jgi:hypothetical protein
VTASAKRRVHGVTTHRARGIERTTHRGIPITTVPRTLVDLAAHLSLDDLARACHEAGSSMTRPRSRSKRCSRSESGREAARTSERSSTAACG